MKSTSFIPCIAVTQLIIGLSLLGIYEAYKVSYVDSNPSLRAFIGDQDSATLSANQTVSFSLRSVATPVDWLFYLATFTNVFCLFFCLAGVLNAVREVIMGFFIFNAIEVVLTFHLFVDIWTDARIRSWSAGDLKGFEKAAIAIMFFNFVLSFIATFLAVKSLQDVRLKQKEEYHRLSVISDNLQFEADNDRL